MSCATIQQSEFAVWVAGQKDGHRYELIQGHVVREPPARWEHGECEACFTRLVGAYVYRRRLGRVFGSRVGIELPSGDTLEPDLTFVSNRRWNETPQRPGSFLRQVPDLVVEILSPSTAGRDQGRKREIYQQNGVREYWLADADARTVTRFVSTARRFDAGQTFGADEVLRSVVLRGFRAAVAGFFAAR